MPYHPEQNATIILLHNSLNNYHLTIHIAKPYSLVLGHVIEVNITRSIDQSEDRKDK